MSGFKSKFTGYDDQTSDAWATFSSTFTGDMLVPTAAGAQTEVQQASREFDENARKPISLTPATLKM